MLEGEISLALFFSRFMVTIIYEPHYSVDIYPDGELEDKARELFLNTSIREVITGQQMFVEAIRYIGFTEFPEGYKNIEFKFGRHFISVDRCYTLDAYPTGFCDLYTKFLFELVCGKR